MAPVGTGTVATVETRQLAADGGGEDRLQRGGTDMYPGLQMAGAGLEHHTRFMSICPHRGNDGRLGTIQVDEDIAGVSVHGVWLDVHIASLAVAHTQKADGREIRQLVCCPQSLAGERPSGAVMNQTDEVKLVWHRRQLAADGLGGKSESAVKHAPNSAIELGCRTMKSRRTGSGVLTHCLSRGAHLSILE